MAIFVEHLSRPAATRARARLVAGSPGAAGEAALRDILTSIGLEHLDVQRAGLGHSYALLSSADIVRAMHAGALPVESGQLDALMKRGRLPFEVEDRRSMATEAASDYA